MLDGDTTGADQWHSRSVANPAAHRFPDLASVPHDVILRAPQEMTQFEQLYKSLYGVQSILF